MADFERISEDLLRHREDYRALVEQCYQSGVLNEAARRQLDEARQRLDLHETDTQPIEESYQRTYAARLLEQLTERLARSEAQFQALDHRFGEMETHNRELQRRLTETEAHGRELNAQLAEAAFRLERFGTGDGSTAAIRELQERLAATERHTSELQSRITPVEQQVNEQRQAFNGALKQVEDLRNQDDQHVAQLNTLRAEVGQLARRLGQERHDLFEEFYKGQ